jgi:hypothetical protein
MYCLKHYALSDSIHSKASGAKGGPKVAESAMKKQRPAMAAAWEEALQGVVLRMYDLQKEEQERARVDPFAMLAMQAPRIDANAFKAAKLKRKRETASDSASASASTSTSGKSGGKGGIMARTNQIWSFKGFEANARQADMDGPLEVHCEGPACEACQSEQTSLQQVGGFGSNVSKCETWGSKDAPEAVFRINCRACNHVFTVRE